MAHPLRRRILEGRCAAGPAKSSLYGIHVDSMFEEFAINLARHSNSKHIHQCWGDSEVVCANCSHGEESYRYSGGYCFDKVYPKQTEPGTCTLLDTGTTHKCCTNKIYHSHEGSRPRIRVLYSDFADGTATVSRPRDKKHGFRNGKLSSRSKAKNSTLPRGRISRLL